MPDAVLFLKAMGTAAGVSALFVLALGWMRRPASEKRLNLARIAAMGLGLLLGHLVLQIRPNWPPANGLDRLLTIIVPAVIGIELLAGFASVPRWLVWLFRLSLSAATGRILLYGSIYVTAVGGEWTVLQAWLSLGGSAILLVLVWSLLLRLADRAPGISIPTAIAEASLCSGVTIMLAGYLTGGAAALPLAAALVGATVGSSRDTARPAMHGAIGIGVVGLFGLLFVAKFFAGLPTGRTLVLFLAPLLCWASELPFLRGRPPWLIGTTRLALVAIPLVVVLVLEKRDFDKHTAPLLGSGAEPDGSSGLRVFNRERQGLDRIPPGFEEWPRERLRDAVGVDRPAAQIVLPRGDVRQQRSPMDNRISHRPRRRLATLHVHADRALRQPVLGQTSTPPLGRREYLGLFPFGLCEPWIVARPGRILRRKSVLDFREP
jgi:hypothetical protein